jgi:hypothetical protein
MFLAATENLLSEAPLHAAIRLSILLVSILQVDSDKF